MPASHCRVDSVSVSVSSEKERTLLTKTFMGEPARLESMLLVPMVSVSPVFLFSCLSENLDYLNSPCVCLRYPLLVYRAKVVVVG